MSIYHWSFGTLHFPLQEKTRVVKSVTVELNSRLLDFAVRIIRLVKALPKTPEGRHVARQLLRSGTSPGANYEESGGAESRADFTHKLGIVLKELKETRYWLRLAAHVPLIKPPSRVNPLLEENEQLVAIFASSVSTLRGKPKKMSNARWQMPNDK